MNKILWWAAGVNPDILKQFPTEHSKYAGMGATIIFTALMASLTGGYAFHMVFDSIPLAIFFGAFWGALILNFDRFIVSTSLKEENPKFKEEAFKYAPRIIIAITLGVIIAVPLELKIFEQEINVQYEKMQTEFLNKDKKQLDSLYTRIPEVEREIDRLKGEINNALAFKNHAENEYICEVQGNCGNSSGVPGRGKVYIEKKAKFESAQAEYEKVSAENSYLIKNLREELDRLRKDKTSTLESRQGQYNEVKENLGLLRRLEALDHLEENTPGMAWKIFFISLFIVLIELAPVISKIIMKPGPYDYAILEINHRAKLTSQKNIHDLNETIKKDIERTMAVSKQDLEGELNANQEVIKAITEAQIAIVKEALTEWKNSEIEKAKKNPEYIIKEMKADQVALDGTKEGSELTELKS